MSCVRDLKERVRLKDIIPEKYVIMWHGKRDIEVSGVTADSRDVQSGSVFFALPGTRVHGISYLKEALKKGAVAVVSDVSMPDVNVPAFVQVRQVRHVFGISVSRWFGEPSRKLEVIFVTGTNGKTTIAWVSSKALNKLGIKTRYIGSLGVSDSQESLNLTTPDALTFQRILRNSLEYGYSYVIAEASSHALHQERLCGTSPRGGVFINLSRDHLDYHQTMESYFEAKVSLFSHLLAESDRQDTFAIVNVDDPHGRILTESLRKEMWVDRLITFSTCGDAHLKGRILEESLNGLRMEIIGENFKVEVFSPLVGRYNAYNLLAVFGICLMTVNDPDAIAHALADVGMPPGRLENVGAPFGKHVFVDYAHTPDALENVLKVLKSLTPGRLIVIFGCGGDRDRGKRPLMGKVASQIADVVIVTSDNPRSEKPEAIIEDILQGVGEEVSHKVEVEVDRAQAIRKGIRMMGKDDVLLIAGKGHEDYQIFADRVIHFSDREQAVETLKEVK